MFVLWFCKATFSFKQQDFMKICHKQDIFSEIFRNICKFRLMVYFWSIAYIFRCQGKIAKALVLLKNSSLYFTVLLYATWYWDEYVKLEGRYCLWKSFLFTETEIYDALVVRLLMPSCCLGYQFKRFF